MLPHASDSKLILSKEVSKADAILSRDIQQAISNGLTSFIFNVGYFSTDQTLITRIKEYIQLRGYWVLEAGNPSGLDRKFKIMWTEPDKEALETNAIVYLVRDLEEKLKFNNYVEWNRKSNSKSVLRRIGDYFEKRNYKVAYGEEETVKISRSLTANEIQIHNKGETVTSPTPLPVNIDEIAEHLKRSALNQAFTWPTQEYATTINLTIQDINKVRDKLIELGCNIEYTGPDIKVNSSVPSRSLRVSRAEPSPYAINVKMPPPKVVDSLPGVAMYYLKDEQREQIRKQAAEVPTNIASRVQSAITFLENHLANVKHDSILWPFVDSMELNTAANREAVTKHFKDKGYSVVTEDLFLRITQPEPFEKTVSRIDEGFKSANALSWSIAYEPKRLQIAELYTKRGYVVEHLTHGNLMIRKPVSTPPAAETLMCSCGKTPAHWHYSIGSGKVVVVCDECNAKQLNAVTPSIASIGNAHPVETCPCPICKDWEEHKRNTDAAKKLASIVIGDGSYRSEFVKPIYTGTWNKITWLSGIKRWLSSTAWRS